ncbi:MAG: hypothetical protein GC131_06720 [Alphaproteobacteria bacterium]|nr:hypothetical protein [Alphaproteobacteria bacterium]
MPNLVQRIGVSFATLLATVGTPAHAGGGGGHGGGGHGGGHGGGEAPVDGGLTVNVSGGDTLNDIDPEATARSTGIGTVTTRSYAFGAPGGASASVDASDLAAVALEQCGTATQTVLPGRASGFTVPVIGGGVSRSETGQATMTAGPDMHCISAVLDSAERIEGVRAAAAISLKTCAAAPRLPARLPPAVARAWTGLLRPPSLAAKSRQWLLRHTGSVPLRRAGVCLMLWLLRSRPPRGLSCVFAQRHVRQKAPANKN